MLAAQLLASHNAAMECYRRAMIAEQTLEGRKENLNHANKLSRTHTLPEAFEPASRQGPAESHLRTRSRLQRRSGRQVTSERMGTLEPASLDRRLKQTFSTRVRGR